MCVCACVRQQSQRMPAHRLTFDPEGPFLLHAVPVPKHVGGVDDVHVLFWSTAESPDNPNAFDVCLQMEIGT